MKENLSVRGNIDITSYVIKYENLQGLHLSTEFFQYAYEFLIMQNV